MEFKNRLLRERKRERERAHLTVAIRRQGYSIAFSKCFQNIVKLKERWKKGRRRKLESERYKQGKRTSQEKDSTEQA